MRLLALAPLVLGLVALAAGCATSPSTLVVHPLAPVRESVQHASKPELPRYFPRAPAKVVVVGQSEAGAAALHGGMRLQLRGPTALPDSAPILLAPQAEAGGAPTSSPPGATLAVPSRLGGGYLFVVGRELWHAPTWLGRPKRLFEFAAAPRVHVGLDALVAQEPGRPAFGFRITGEQVPLSHWPESPAIADVASRDGKHAAVVADLRGLAVTDDGGESWHEVATPRTPFGVRIAPGGYQVRGRNGTEDHDVGWLVDVHGELRSDSNENASTKRGTVALGDGWERVVRHGYADGERWVVLDRGTFELIRRADGERIAQQVVSDPADTCRPIHWPSSHPGAAPGFACTGAAGTTLWQVHGQELVRAFQLPGARRVWSSEIGSLALEGPCEGGRGAATTTTLCVWGRSGAVPTTVRLQGATAADLIAPLPDGSVAIVRPPTGPAKARRLAELFLDGGHQVDRAQKSPRVEGVPLRPVASIPADTLSMLTDGHWLGDLEAVAGGGFAGWIEHDGRLLGVRATLDGGLEVGPRSGVASVHRTAGLRSFSWSNAGASFESTDGGMHYTQTGLPAIEAQPEPKVHSLEAKEATAAHGCTAIGCILPQLIRVGWGGEEARSEPLERPRTSPSTPQLPGRIALDCTLVARSTDTVRVQKGAAAAVARYGTYGISQTGSTSFFGLAAPAVRPDQTVQGWDAVDPSDHRTQTSLGRVYLWGTYALGPDPDAGWQWRWYDAGTHGVHTTAIAKPPEEVSLQHQMQTSQMPRATWSIVGSSDPRHALGVQTDGTRSYVFSLAEGEAPSEIELEDGGDFGALEAAIAAPGDRALLAGPVGDPAGTAVFVAHGGKAEQVARIPRVGTQGKPAPALLALHSDGVRVAVLVEDHDVAYRSDAAFYLREAYPSMGPLRRYALAGDDRVLRACKGDAPGFEAWTHVELPGDVRIAGSSKIAHLVSPTRARIRFLDEGSLCLAEVTSGVDSEGSTTLGTTRLAPTATGSIPLTFESSGRRSVLACSAGSAAEPAKPALRLK